MRERLVNRRHRSKRARVSRSWQGRGWSPGVHLADVGESCAGASLWSSRMSPHTTEVMMTAALSKQAMSEAWRVVEERRDAWGVVRRYRGLPDVGPSNGPASAAWEFGGELDRVAVEVVIAGAWRPGELLGWVPGPNGGWLANVSYAVGPHQDCLTRVPADLVRPVDG